MKHMRKMLAFLLALTMLSSMLVITGAAADAKPALVEGKILTEVLDWGETITGLRLEYTEEIRSSAIRQNNEHPGGLTYFVVGDHEIDCVYVNNSGVKDEVEATGKYVFINFCVGSHDWINYRDYVTFNTSAKVRPASDNIYFYQMLPLTTVSGKTIDPIGRTATKGEIRIGVENFSSFLYKYKGDQLEEDAVFYYHLYIPEGYDKKSASLDDIPLIVHFPSGDVTYNDYSGLYYGALFTHNDATEWASPEAQSEHPAFVMTYGSSVRPSDFSVIYLDIINTLIKEYNIDTSRIYGIGLAAGDTTMWRMAYDHPDLFAGTISTAYDFRHAFGDEALSKFKQFLDIVPNSWFFVGEDDDSGRANMPADELRNKGERLRDSGFALNEDGYNIDIAYGEKGELMWNGLLRGPKAEAQAQEQLERAEKNGSNALITLFTANTIRQTGHWSWTATYTNSVVRDWLFQQVNDNPYTPSK